MNQKNKLLKNKKGQEMLIDFWTIIIFTGIVIIFLVLFYISKGDVGNTAKDEFKSKDVNIILTSFLRAPAYFDYSKTAAEIISEDSYSKDFTRTQSIVQKLFVGVDTYNNKKVKEIILCVKKDSSKLVEYSIKYDNNNYAISTKGGGECESSLQYNYAEENIPRHDTNSLYVKLGVLTVDK